MEPKERFAQNLRRERQRLGLSQEDLGAKAGIHRTEISLLERAGRDPRLNTIVRVSRALGIPARDLLDGIG